MTPPQDSSYAPPPWLWEALVCPTCRATLGASLSCSACGMGATVEGGVVCFYAQTRSSEAAESYRAAGGTRIVDRSLIPMTMTWCDAPLYRAAMERASASVDLDRWIVDVGAGDGRNALPWLEWGYQRVVLVDASRAGLMRARDRLMEHAPSALNRVAFIEANAMAIPLIAGCAGLVLAIESLYYLNDDYSTGLGECARVLAPGGSVVLSERSWEGGVLTTLLYGDPHRLAELCGKAPHFVWDGPTDHLTRSRCFHEPEIVDEVERAGLEIIDLRGMPITSLVVGFLNGVKKGGGNPPISQEIIGALGACLATRGGRRTHLITARRR